MNSIHELTHGNLALFLEQQVQAEFALPPNMAHHIEYGAFDHLEDSLAPQLYRSRLHMLLHVEESERRKQMTRSVVYIS